MTHELQVTPAGNTLDTVYERIRENMPAVATPWLT